MKKLYFSLLILLLCFVANAQIVNIPDANFKAKLLSASSSNQVASTQIPTYNSFSDSWSVSNYQTIDTNGDGEIQVSEAQVIKWLNVNNTNISNLDGLNSFSNLQVFNCVNMQTNTLNVSELTNLKSLNCSSSQITSLNVDGLTNIISLDCSDNLLTILNISSLSSMLTLNCGNNNLTTLNANGLVNLKKLSCNSNQLTSLSLVNLTSLKALDCGSNFLQSIDVSGCLALYSMFINNNQLSTLTISNLNSLYYLRCNFNQLTSLSLNNLNNLENLYCSDNLLTTLNVNGLNKLVRLACQYNQLSTLDISNLSNINEFYCDHNLLSSISMKNANLYWGELNFNSNPNLQYICTDEEDIVMVQTKVNSYGLGTTCQVNSYCSFVPSGTYFTIQGNNKFDGNANGCDASDGFLPNMKYSITNGTISGTLISNASGNYSIPVSAGTHTITPQFENPTYFTVSPTNVSVTFPSTTSPFIQDFCIVPNGVHHDLEVVIIPLIPARPGFDATYKIKYKNKGTVSETATLVFNFDDAILDFISSTLTPTTTSTGSLSWNIGTIAPFQSGEFVVTLNVNSPMETPAVNGGDVLSYTATINGLNTDETPTDNTFSLRQTVVNSYDPNDKTCLEGTTINPTMIGEYVHYQIRFENTGTYPAENIVVKDMIDTAKFDISTLQITDTSHSCVTRITNPNKVEFIFQNINLPFDDATNDGYVVFKIKTKPTLTVGSTISNLANIYFDYNFPIITNTATSTFQTLSNNSFNSDNYLNLSPNPAKDILNLNIQDFENIKSIAIYNMLGQLVQITTSPRDSINVSDLKTGNYIIKLHTEKGQISGKFIKE